MKHGTFWAYSHYKCRCELCKLAWNDYHCQLRAKNPNVSRKAYRKRCANNPEKEHKEKREAQARWRINNPNDYKRARGISRLAYRARKKNQFVENVDRQIVYETHGGMCGICKEFIIGKFHVDHVIPLAKGGVHCYTNVQPAHPLCNIRKKDK
jgi:hypothetical protein